MNDRYAWLKSFIAEWRPRPIEPGDGFSEAEIRQAEECLGIIFPVALCEWYLLAGKRKDITNRYSRPIGLDTLVVRYGILYIWETHQDVAYYGVALSDNQADPTAWIWEDGAFQPYRLDVPLSQFLLDMVAYELLSRQRKSLAARLTFRNRSI